jgi:hypothetical protein
LPIEAALHIGIAIDGTPDEIVLCATPLSNNSDIIASIDWLKSL